MFNTITVAGAASIYIMVGFVPEDYPMLSIACFAMVKFLNSIRFTIIINGKNSFFPTI